MVIRLLLPHLQFQDWALYTHQRTHASPSVAMELVGITIKTQEIQ